MTEEEEKAIEYYTKRIDMCNENANICDENDFDEEATQLREEKRQTEIILNLIKSQQKEIEILKSEIELHVDTVDEYVKELEEQYKIISNIENYIEKEINIKAEDILGIICNTETYIKNENNIVRNINLRIIKQLNQELEKKDEIIDLIENDLYELAVSINEEYSVEGYLLDKQKLKQYFEKKVEGKK